MPRPKSSNRHEREDDPDDVVMTQTQGTSTQADKVIAALTPDEKQRKINDLVQYLLIADQKKMPVKRQDINKHVMKEHSKGTQWFIDQATEKLKNIFGINLIELESKQKSYILVNCVENDSDEPHQEWPMEDNAKMGLVMVLLSLIFMNGNVIQDSLLFHTLRKLGVDIDHPHEQFGDVRKFLTVELVRQGYIEAIKQPNTDPPTYEFKWGPRAIEEITKRNVLDFVCQIYGDVNPKMWTSQWQDMIRTEGEIEEEEVMENGEESSS